jgi:hypothetical protein
VAVDIYFEKQSKKCHLMDLLASQILERSEKSRSKEPSGIFYGFVIRD